MIRPPATSRGLRSRFLTASKARIEISGALIRRKSEAAAQGMPGRRFFPLVST